jgi:hypothetical protein
VSSELEFQDRAKTPGRYVLLPVGTYENTSARRCRQNSEFACSLELESHAEFDAILFKSYVLLPVGTYENTSARRGRQNSEFPCTSSHAEFDAILFKSNFAEL